MNHDNLSAEPIFLEQNSTFSVALARSACES